MISGLLGFRDALPCLIINSPFLFKKTPSILSRYCDSVKEMVYGRDLAEDGVLDTDPPAPIKLMYSACDSNEVSWKPVTIAVESTLGLKSITFFRLKLPCTAELKSGISSATTPASWM